MPQGPDAEPWVEIAHAESAPADSAASWQWPREPEPATPVVGPEV